MPKQDESPVSLSKDDLDNQARLRAELQAYRLGAKAEAQLKSLEIHQVLSPHTNKFSGKKLPARAEVTYKIWVPSRDRLYSGLVGYFTLEFANELMQMPIAEIEKAFFKRAEDGSLKAIRLPGIITRDQVHLGKERKDVLKK